MEKVLIVIPAYNEEQTIAAVIEGLRQAVPAYDRVVVNDGSKDGTGRIVAGMYEKQLWLPCNLGYGNALQTGLKYGLQSGYEIIVSFDGDGQHRPEDVQLVATAPLFCYSGCRRGHLPRLGANAACFCPGLRHFDLLQYAVVHHLCPAGGNGAENGLARFAGAGSEGQTG